MQGSSIHESKELVDVVDQWGDCLHVANELTALFENIQVLLLGDFAISLGNDLNQQVTEDQHTNNSGQNEEYPVDALLIQHVVIELPQHNKIRILQTIHVTGDIAFLMNLCQAVERVSKSGDDNGKHQQENLYLFDDGNQHPNEVWENLNASQVVKTSHPHEQAAECLNDPELLRLWLIDCALINCIDQNHDQGW